MLGEYKNKVMCGYTTKDVPNSDGVANIDAEFAPVFMIDNKLIGMNGLEEGYSKVRTLMATVSGRVVAKEVFMVYGGIGYKLRFYVRNGIPMGLDECLDGYEVEAMGGDKLFVSPWADGEIKLVKYECGVKRLVKI